MTKKDNFYTAVGIGDITTTINEYFETDVSTRHVHRLLANGKIPSEKRTARTTEPFITNVASLHALGNPDCDIRGGYADIANYTDLSERAVRDEIKDGRLPVDKPFGRFWSTVSSLEAYISEHKPKKLDTFHKRINSKLRSSKG